MPSSVLEEAIASIPEPYRTAFREHLDGDTSADYLAGWLERYGKKVGATTIRTYRRKKKESQ